MYVCMRREFEQANLKNQFRSKLSVDTLHWTTLSGFNTYQPARPESLSTNCQDVGKLNPSTKYTGSQLIGVEGWAKVRDRSEREREHVVLNPQ